MPSFTASTTSPSAHLHRSDAQSKCTINPASEELGIRTLSLDGTLAHRWNIIGCSTSSEKTRAGSMSETVLLKHKFLTQPTVSPEGTIVAAAQQLTTALKVNTGIDKELEALTKVADLFEKIAKDKAATV